jgi:hypothetical protein
MIFGIVSLIVLYIVWMLFIDGWLWKLILLCAGWVGIRYLLLTYWPSSAHIFMVVSSHPVSWAAAIASGVCVMALLTTRD